MSWQPCMNHVNECYHHVMKLYCTNFSVFASFILFRFAISHLQRIEVWRNTSTARTRQPKCSTVTFVGNRSWPRAVYVVISTFTGSTDTSASIVAKAFTSRITWTNTLRSCMRKHVASGSSASTVRRGEARDQGAVSVWRCCFTNIGIPIIKRRQSHDCLLFVIRILFLEDNLYVEMRRSLWHWVSVNVTIDHWCNLITHTQLWDSRGPFCICGWARSGPVMSHM